MTTEQLISALFNLGAQTNFWNSSTAAGDFWLAFGAVAVAAIVFFTVRMIRRRRARQHPFGHSLNS